jgi:hypothetical protein
MSGAENDDAAKAQRALDDFNRETAGRKSPVLERQRHILVAWLEAEKAKLRDR